MCKRDEFRTDAGNKINSLNPISAVFVTDKPFKNNLNPWALIPSATIVDKFSTPFPASLIFQQPKSLATTMVPLR
jgi:hypothetical protein